jgi:hypothetical protein
MIASGIVKNDNQQLNMHEAGRIIPRGRVLCKRISRRTNPVSNYQNSSIVMAGMNPKMAKAFLYASLQYPLNSLYTADRGN